MLSAAEAARKLAETSGNAQPRSFYRPVSQKILDSCGDLGVPRVQKKSPTKAKEFALSSARKRVAEDAPHDELKPIYSSFGVATKANVKRHQVAPSAAAPPPKPTATSVKPFNLASASRPKKPLAAASEQPLYSSFGSSKTPSAASTRKLPKTAAPTKVKVAATPNAPAKPTSEEKLLQAAEAMSMLREEASEKPEEENAPSEELEDAPEAAAESTAVDIADADMDEFVSAREEIVGEEEEQATPPQEPPTILHESMHDYAEHTGLTPSRA